MGKERRKERSSEERKKERVLLDIDSLELKLRVDVNCLMWILGAKLDSLLEKSVFLTPIPTLKPQRDYSY